MCLPSAKILNEFYLATILRFDIWKLFNVNEQTNQTIYDGELSIIYHFRMIYFFSEF